MSSRKFYHIASPREKERMVELSQQGVSNKVIAGRFDVSESTVLNVCRAGGKMR